MCIRDSNTNLRALKFEYGLPTANLVAGATIEGVDLWGLDFYGEWDRNFRYSQYPNAPRFIANEGHEISRRTADARYLTVSKQQYPFFVHGEGYNIDEDYSTRTLVVDTSGDIEYDNLQIHAYEFVDDNDDQDAIPEWLRSGSKLSDTNVFPGWDENNDFISDFNQNDNPLLSNIIPDFEEPFLRFNVDRPEFLFVFHALQRLGAVAALINTHLTGRNLAHVVGVASPAKLIFGSEHAGHLAALKEHLPELDWARDVFVQRENPEDDLAGARCLATESADISAAPMPPLPFEGNEHCA